LDLRIGSLVLYVGLVQSAWRNRPGAIGLAQSAWRNQSGTMGLAQSVWHIGFLLPIARPGCTICVINCAHESALLVPEAPPP
jgi:hypothetical protein